MTKTDRETVEALAQGADAWGEINLSQGRGGQSDDMAAYASTLRALSAENDRLREALEVVAYMGHDAPMTWAGSDYEWEKRRSGMMQSAARAALKDTTQ